VVNSDYGKVDWMVREGRPIMLDTDMNPTVESLDSDRMRRVAADLARGIGGVTS
jgi:hypothetical protein